MAAAFALLLGVAGCSDDGDDTAATSTTTEASAAPDGDDGAGTGGDTTSTDPGETTTTGADEPTTTVAPGPTGPGGTDVGPLPELTAAEQPYADAIVEDFADDDSFLPDADNACLATRWVHAIGGDALEASGLTPEEFADDGPAAVGIDRATAEQMIDSMSACNAGAERFYALFASTAGNGPDEGLTTQEQEVMVACMKDEVPLSELREALVTSFLGDDDAGMEVVTDKWSVCLPDRG